MLDWFVVLTPLLVLPIVLLIVFVGCGPGEITGGDWVQGTFVVSFYITAARRDTPQIEDHAFVFSITDASQEEVATSTVGFGEIEILQEGIGGTATRLQHQFSDYFTSRDATFSCQVVDAFDQATLVAGGATCARNFELHEHYLIAYSALVSDDEITPQSTFDFCNDDIL